MMTQSFIVGVSATFTLLLMDIIVWMHEKAAAWRGEIAWLHKCSNVGSEPLVCLKAFAAVLAMTVMSIMSELVYLV